MSDDYRLRADLQRIIANAGEAPHWNTASDRPEMPARYTRADINAAVQRAIEACAWQGYIACAETRHVSLGKSVEGKIRALLAPAALERIIDGGKG
jgi:hypothetical protein